MFPDLILLYFIWEIVMFISVFSSKIVLKFNFTSRMSIILRLSILSLYIYFSLIKLIIPVGKILKFDCLSFICTFCLIGTSFCHILQHYGLPFFIGRIEQSFDSADFWRVMDVVNIYYSHLPFINQSYNRGLFDFCWFRIPKIVK